jgi:hypothetical protein
MWRMENVGIRQFAKHWPWELWISHHYPYLSGLETYKRTSKVSDYKAMTACFWKPLQRSSFLYIYIYIYIYKTTSPLLHRPVNPLRQNSRQPLLCLWSLIHRSVIRRCSYGYSSKSSIRSIPYGKKSWGKGQLQGEDCLPLFPPYWSMIQALPSASASQSARCIISEQCEIWQGVQMRSQQYPAKCQTEGTLSKFEFVSALN